jgi:hypothetical protein
MSVVYPSKVKKQRGRPKMSAKERRSSQFAGQMRMTQELKNFLDLEKLEDESYAEEILRLVRQERHEKIALKRKLDECSQQS